MVSAATENPQPRRENDFDAWRLIAALTVIVGHAWPLTGVPSAPRLGGYVIHHDAVFVFFAISGFLIATSWLRAPRIGRFVRHRFWRIVPALAVVVSVTVFAIGPFVTTDVGYFADPRTWSYLGNVVFVAQYDLPGVFTGNPTSAVNGSLWTLGAEVACYLGVIIVCLLARRFSALGFGLAFAGLVALALIPGAVPSDMKLVPTAMAFFAAGAVLAHPKPRGWVRAWPAALAVVVWIIMGMLSVEAGKVLAWLVVPYAVVAFGTRSTPIMRSAGRFGDFSYGLYLWGFPVQQLVVLWLGLLPLWLDLLIVVPVTLGLAVASWYLVERVALARARREQPARAPQSARIR